jgi:F0F1-type ATP synthase membrane subunit b/b'
MLFQSHTIAWACRQCRQELVRGAIERQERELAEIARRRKQEAVARLLEAVLAEIGRLPEKVMAALREAASQGGRLGRLA